MRMKFRLVRKPAPLEPQFEDILAEAGDELAALHAVRAVRGIVRDAADAHERMMDVVETKEFGRRMERFCGSLEILDQHLVDRMARSAQVQAVSRVAAALAGLWVHTERLNSGGLKADFGKSFDEVTDCWGELMTYTPQL
ncbi:MAG: hypothetical protein AAB964_02190 [Patescibacteria group bacterium]